MAISCNQCNMLAINGVPCHETGCPNERKVWRDGEWVKLVACIECGNEYEDEDEAYQCCTRDWSHEELDNEYDDEDDDPDRLEATIEGVAPFFDVDPDVEN